MDIRIREKLDSLSEKVAGLLAEKEELKKDLQYYQKENRELRASLDQAKENAKNFPERAESTIIAGENGRYAEKVASISKKIDVCVEEIDRCIAQLEN
jgi:regulator of replication initiation timing